LSENLVKFAKHARRQSKKDRQMGTPDQERKALSTLRVEARRNGATLKSNGEGGLSSVLVLQVFRKGHWKCDSKNCPTPKKDLTVDHISGHPKEIAADSGARKRPDLRRGISLGHVDKLEALHILCGSCHDKVHNREREIAEGKKPKPM